MSAPTSTVIRPASATAWTVAAALWALPAITLGVLGVHRAWSEYRVWHQVFDSHDDILLLTDPSGSWIAVSVLAFPVAVVWIALSLTWLGIGAARLLERPQPRAAGAQVATVAAVLAVAALAAVEMVRDDLAMQTVPSEAHLVTTAFLCSVVLMVAGIVALAICRWPLRDERVAARPTSSAVRRDRTG